MPLLVVDEVGYIPFDPEAANLMFSLVSNRYERASMIVTSNKPFSAWGEIFGDDMAATAMIDRLIHHAEILSLKGPHRGVLHSSAGPSQPGHPYRLALEHPSEAYAVSSTSVSDHEGFGPGAFSLKTPAVVNVVKAVASR